MRIMFYETYIGCTEYNSARLFIPFFYIKCFQLRNLLYTCRRSDETKIKHRSVPIFKISTLWLTHWGRVTHICVGKLSIIGSDNGLSPGRRQAIIWTNAGISLIGPLGTNFCEILIGIQTFSFKKLHLKTSSAKWRLFCLGLNELKKYFTVVICNAD